jgi:hypothetical protein
MENHKKLSNNMAILQPKTREYSELELLIAIALPRFVRKKILVHFQL